MNEWDEIANTLSLASIETYSDARTRVRLDVGEPDDIGYQMFDNIAESLFARALRAKRNKHQASK